MNGKLSLFVIESVEEYFSVKFMFSKKATKIDEIFTVNLTLCGKCQIDSEDFVIFVAFLENTNFNNQIWSIWQNIP